jgi:hypothetical protein
MQVRFTIRSLSTVQLKIAADRGLGTLNSARVGKIPFAPRHPSAYPDHENGNHYHFAREQLMTQTDPVVCATRDVAVSRAEARAGDASLTWKEDEYGASIAHVGMEAFTIFATPVHQF